MNENQEMVDEAQVGRILHFVTEGGRCRPSVVVEDWPESGRPGYVNLIVFTDGTNDGDYGVDQHYHGYSHDPMNIRIGGPPQPLPRTSGANNSLLTRWETSVLPNHAVKAVRSWHWPRECVHMQQPMAPYVNEAKETFHHNHAEGMVDTHNCIACSYAAKAKVDA